MRQKNILIMILIFLILSVVTIAVCLRGVSQIYPEEFERLMLTEDVFLLNTHTPYEGEIRGTDLIIEDWGNIALYEDDLPSDKKKIILVYCKVGFMSSDASHQLAEIGYKKVYNLEGGMDAWNASGREIVYLKH